MLLTIVLFIFNYSHWIYFPLDVPMSSGVSNIRSKGNLLNCYEFEWDPNKGSEVYIIVSRNLVKDSVSIIVYYCLILSITKFLIMIGSLFACLTHCWYGITWVSSYSWTLPYDTFLYQDCSNITYMYIVLLTNGFPLNFSYSFQSLWKTLKKLPFFKFVIDNGD